MRWLSVSLVVVGLDQASKHVVAAWLGGGQVRPVLPGVDLVLARNPGISFSLLALPSDLQRWPLAGFGLAVALGLVIWLWRLPGGRPRAAAGLALILGGALGNLVDRIARGTVIDFIWLHWGGWTLFVFNLADAAITLGVALLLLDGLRARARSREAAAG
jgi:signal peptidase II